jgi:hypothetical protein
MNTPIPDVALALPLTAATQGAVFGCNDDGMAFGSSDHRSRSRSGVHARCSSCTAIPSPEPGNMPVIVAEGQVRGEIHDIRNMEP